VGRKAWAPFVRAFADLAEYRAEIEIWMISGSLPLVMMAVWIGLASSGPIGGYSADDFVAYFLLVFLVRQFTVVWVVWELDREIRLGELSPKLLRPSICCGDIWRTPWRSRWCGSRWWRSRSASGCCGRGCLYRSASTRSSRPFCSSVAARFIVSTRSASVWWLPQIGFARLVIGVGMARQGTLTPMHLLLAGALWALSQWLWRAALASYTSASS
jgi:ABC-type uncharacterized transport system permease subunit